MVDVYVFIYLDDFLIYSAIAEDHTRYIRAVFERLSKSKFYLKHKKYALFLPEIDFLGHVVSKSEVSGSPGKVSTI